NTGSITCYRKRTPGRIISHYRENTSRHYKTGRRKIPAHAGRKGGSIELTAPCNIHQLLSSAAGIAGIPPADGYLFIYFQGSAPGRKRNVFICAQLRM